MFQQDFGVEEFRARRRRMCDAAGPGAWILVPGAPGRQGNDGFRQYNEFYYLCGVEVPHAYLLVNSANAKTTLFLPRESLAKPQEEGEPVHADNADYVKGATGVDAAAGLELLPQHVQRASAIYLPFEELEDRSVSRDTLRNWYQGVMADPLDGRLTRSAHIVDVVRRRYPQIEVRNLSPIVDELRLIKSPREIEMLRRAGHLTAVGVNEAMRSTRSGVMEYQLDAVLRYHFLAGGAMDRGYFSLIPSGANIFHGHYHANRHELKDGDWLLCDAAPDYGYYTSDIGRMWPVNGKYSPRQRALYGYVVEYHKALLARIRPGRMLTEIALEAAEAMRPVFERWEFGSGDDRASAALMFEFRGHLSHCVGMAVHDGGLHHTRPLAPGVVFSVDPTLLDRERKLYVRVEDTVAVTETGIENLTAEAPLELDDVEKMMRGKGLLQAFPPA